MTGVRRALVLVTAERYFGLAVNFMMVATVSRVLTPAEVGVSVIGSGIMALMLSLREFTTAEFLIQREEVARADVRTSFTLLFALSALISAVVIAAANSFADLYGEPKLANFLRLVAVAGVLESFALPLTAVLRRNMAFGALAAVNLTSAAVGASVTLALALLGFSYMSFAWAWLSAAVATVVLSLRFNPQFWIYVPSLSSWRAALTFGGYNGATNVLAKAHELLPQLVLGRVLPISAVGLYNRASVIGCVPDRFLLAGVFTVAFPAFAAELRAGRNLKDPILRAISYITVVYSPAQILLVLMAHPTVRIILGEQWVSIVPLVQIMVLASLFWFPVMLMQPILLSFGAFRQNLIAKFICVGVSASVLCIASFFGLLAMAASQLLTLPFQMTVALYFIRRYVPLGRAELLSAISKSALVTFCSAFGPIMVIAFAGFRFDLSIIETLVASVLAAVGWAAGLRVTRHPFLFEIARAADAIADSSALGHRVVSVGLRLRNRASMPRAA